MVTSKQFSQGVAFTAMFMIPSVVFANPPESDLGFGDLATPMQSIEAPRVVPIGEASPVNESSLSSPTALACDPAYPVECGSYCCSNDFPLCAGDLCCPLGYPVNCGDGTCGATSSDCGGGGGGGGGTCSDPSYPVQCSTGCCGIGTVCGLSNNCCPESTPYDCGNGTCSATSSGCDGGGGGGGGGGNGDYYCEGGNIDDGSCSYLSYCLNDNCQSYYEADGRRFTCSNACDVDSVTACANAVVDFCQSGGGGGGGGSSDTDTATCSVGDEGSRTGLAGLLALLVVGGLGWRRRSR